MLDVSLGARPDEKAHFFLMYGPPTFLQTRWGIFRKTTWHLPFRSGEYFVSYWVWKLQFYIGGAKVDGSRTIMYWTGGLDNGMGKVYNPDPSYYIVTDHPKELLAFRFRRSGPVDPSWDVMGAA